MSTPNCTWVGCALGFLTDIRLGCVALTLTNTLAYYPAAPEKESKKLKKHCPGANPIKLLRIFTYFEIS